MKYIVVGDDIDVKRLPTIYKLMRQELKLGRNITTDRLTRILKLEELLNDGFTKRESAELMDVPIHIVHSDCAVLKEIEHISI